jgi:membrane-bound serine protease (ClpP class)
MRRKPIWMIFLVWLVSAFFTVTALAQRGGNVLVLTVEGAVSPTMLGYIERGIAEAEAQGAEAMVIQLNTPGGQLDLTRQIVQVIVNARVPVVVYVYPSGGFAASAGTFITLAGHAAAMAPQTSIGAASPVDMQGGNIDTTLQAKVENILVADIKNLTERRGEKAVEWAKEAILKAKAASANEALELGIIDFIAVDLNDLLTQMDGFEVVVQGETRTLNTAEAIPISFTMTPIEQLLSIILRPEIAFILLSIGSLAIVYELANPGGFVSGVIGVICLLLGLYAIGQLPINFAGLGLMGLAFILFVAEAFAPTHGALTTAGVISLLIGGLLLFDTAELDYRISIVPVAGVSVSLGLIFFFIVSKAVTALRQKPASGRESLIGATGVAKTVLSPEGIVFVDGSRWQAVVEDSNVEVGDEVEVVAMRGFKLTVRKKESITAHGFTQETN